MVRTQIYLTEQQLKQLSAMAKRTGKTQSQLIRETVDQLIDRTSPSRRTAVLQEAASLWKDREDLPDFREFRTEWDRR